MPKTKHEPEPEPSNADSLQPLLEGMLTLLGRFVYPPEKLMEIVTFKKRNPEQSVEIYNLCDGEHTGTEVAKTFSYDQGALSRLLLDWKELGIVYEINKKGGKFYKKLYTLPSKKPEPSKEIRPEQQSMETAESTPVTLQPESNDKS